MSRPSLLCAEEFRRHASFLLCPRRPDCRYAQRSGLVSTPVASLADAQRRSVPGNPAPWLRGQHCAPLAVEASRQLADPARSTTSQIARRAHGRSYPNVAGITRRPDVRDRRLDGTVRPAQPRRAFSRKRSESASSVRARRTEQRARTTASAEIRSAPNDAPMFVKGQFRDGAGKPVMGHSRFEGRLLSGHAVSRRKVERRAGKSFAGQPGGVLAFRGPGPPLRSWRYTPGRWRYTSRAT